MSRFPFVFAFALALLPPAAVAQAPVLDQSAYVAALDQCLASLHQAASPADAARLNAALPSAWHVGEATVQLDWLHRGLASLARPPFSPGLALSLAARVQWLRDQAIAPPPAHPDARGRLDRILRRPAFRRVAPESAWDRLRARIQAALLRALMRLFGSVPLDRPLGVGLLFLLLLFAFSALAWVLLRLANDPRRSLQLAGGSLLASRGWQEWRRLACAAAAAGHWDEAIGCAYSAGVARLAADGFWPLDWTRTPREYSALVTPSDAHFPAWNLLARRFEDVRFAGCPPDADAAADALRSLDGLAVSGLEEVHAA